MVDHADSKGVDSTIMADSMATGEDLEVRMLDLSLRHAGYYYGSLIGKRRCDLFKSLIRGDPFVQNPCVQNVKKKS